MTLSIIIPVYNVERHLERCIQSIVSQLPDDCEILLIDDGSTDCCGVLCDELQQRHHMIRVVHQHNQGLSAARNKGLDIAQGEYITFIDSDDELCSHTLKENLAHLLAHPEVDMLEYPVEVHANTPKAYLLRFPDETQQTDIFADWIRREGYLHCYAWNKIYRAHLWRDTRFPIGEYYEDTAVMPSIIKQCRAIHYSANGCYRYIMHEGTITTSYRYDKQRQLFLNNHRLYLEIKDNPSLASEAMHLWTCCLNLLIDMGRCADVDRIDYHYLIGEASKYRPAYGPLFKAVSVATRIKLSPLPLIGLQAYFRLYATFKSTLKA